MLPHLSSHFSKLPVYQKAIDIIVLSRNISAYLNQDLNQLKEDGSEDVNIYFSGDIVRQSTSLAPEIIKAELERYSEKRQKHLESLRKLTSRLYSSCYRLEKCNSNGKDYIPLLRRELKTFKRLQHSWMLNL